ncbi:MAG: hypothetical protein CMJ75_19130 [Planctomycetaceae bacterium]|nr:hypothetical protein [Planctomycetaceae bacterium]
MKIESLRRRPGGTVVELETTVYRFQPTPDDPRHQADVEIKSHIERFLSIPEGFRELDGVTEANPLKSSRVHAAVYDLPDGSRMTLAELTSRAFRESGLGVTEWNNLSDEEAYEQIDTTLREIKYELVHEDNEPAGDTENTLVPEQDDEPEQVLDEEPADDEQDEAPKEEPEPAVKESEQSDKPAGDSDKVEGAAVKANADLDSMSREELEARYEALYKRKAHHRVGDPRLRELIAEYEAE